MKKIQDGGSLRCMFKILTKLNMSKMALLIHSFYYSLHSCFYFIIYFLKNSCTLEFNYCPVKYLHYNNTA